MSVNDLPEELLEQILSVCLSLPSWGIQEYFCDGGTSLRVRIRARNAGLLLVSKAWFRISAPLLYSSVVLSTPTQIKVLATVLQRNPELGTVIRSLWLEPGFPKELYEVVQRAPNIDRLCLTLSLNVGDHVNGLRKALPLMNPKIVCLLGLGRRWQNAARLEEVLASCVKNCWTSLVSKYNLYGAYQPTNSRVFSRPVCGSSPHTYLLL